MKKSVKKYPIIEDWPLSVVSDIEAVYQVRHKPTKKEPAVKDFTYQHFKKIADRAPFSLNEWADLLYISERSLHRYAKEGSGFNGLQIERILLLATLIDTGNEFFGKEGFGQWLHSRPFSLNGSQVKDLLTTHNEIQEVIDLLHRMEHGISA
ncbi:antitoxin Xre-like helix-turn-helix domain-containing protein [Niabella aurantiaca]|uniref:antitoxin Xre-like helix-turn-helix domain-containing protein n=1 Tax=Niabella aurantiaca TaxID=379900 RepID=UPI000367458E|nr:antitoxin Xre-like helix-turn-helix domain-containing protein [Niabella aurantiaca]